MRELRPVLRLMRPYKTFLGFGFFLACLTSLGSVGLLILSGWFIAASAVAGLAAGAVGAIGFNFLFPSAGIRGLAIGRTLSRYAERLATHDATFRILAELRVWLYRRLIPLAPGQLARLRSGDLLNRVTGDIDALDSLYLRLMVPAGVAAVTVLAVALLLVFVAWWAPLVMLVAAGVAGVAVPAFARRVGKAEAEVLPQALGDLRTDVVDAAAGIRELEAYGASSRQAAAVDARTGGLLEPQRKLARQRGRAAAGAQLAVHGGLLLALLFGALAVSGDAITGPQAALIAFAVWVTGEALLPLTPAVQLFDRTLRAGGRVRELAEEPPLTPVPATPETLPEGPSDLRFEGVRYAYPGQTVEAVSGVDLTVPAGGRIGLLGPSGSGKTTLLQLALRFDDPGMGTVRLGRTDLRRVRLETLFERIGYLSQTTELFDGTVRYNIAMARPGAAEAEIEAAVAAAGLARFVADQPDGLDTWVGENGIALSGGQARRVALARVILKDAPVLLLDEPTEGLDPETEEEVLTALDRFAEGRTTLIVTHRPHPAFRVDRSYVMEAGMLADVPARPAAARALHP